MFFLSSLSFKIKLLYFWIEYLLNCHLMMWKRKRCTKICIQSSKKSIALTHNPTPIEWIRWKSFIKCKKQTWKQNKNRNQQVPEIEVHIIWIGQGKLASFPIIIGITRVWFIWNRFCFQKNMFILQNWLKMYSSK